MAKSIIEKKYFLIEYIRKHQPISRYDIAKRFNMNPATVGNIIDELIKEKIIIETAVNKRGVGRPPILLQINPDGGSLIGIDFFKERITGVRINFRGDILSHYTKKISQEIVSKEQILKYITNIISRLIKEDDITNIKGIGIGAPGIIDKRKGESIIYEYIEGWENVPLKEIISSTFNLPTFVEHNTNTFALGEIWKGHGQGYSHVISIVLRTGVSIGIIYNRELYNQGDITAGEFGHVTINMKGPKCRCGNRGCLEVYLSKEVLRDKFIKKIKNHSSWKNKLDILKDPSCITPELLCKFAIEGDEISREILEESFIYLGYGIINLITILGPEAIIINGKFNLAGDMMKNKILEVMNHITLPIKKPAVIVSTYDDRISAVGAGLMALSRIYSPLYYFL